MFLRRSAAGFATGSSEPAHSAALWPQHQACAEPARSLACFPFLVKPSENEQCQLLTEDLLCTKHVRRRGVKVKNTGCRKALRELPVTYWGVAVCARVPASIALPSHSGRGHCAIGVAACARGRPINMRHECTELPWGLSSTIHTGKGRHGAKSKFMPSHLLLMALQTSLEKIHTESDDCKR